MLHTQMYSFTKYGSPNYEYGLCLCRTVIRISSLMEVTKSITCQVFFKQVIVSNATNFEGFCIYSRSWARLWCCFHYEVAVNCIKFQGAHSDITYKMWEILVPKELKIENLFRFSLFKDHKLRVDKSILGLGTNNSMCVCYLL